MSYDQEMAAAKEIGKGIATLYLMEGQSESVASNMAVTYWNLAADHDFVDEALRFLKQNPYASTKEMHDFWHKEMEKAKKRKKEETMKKLKIGLIIAAVAVVAIIVLTAVL